MRHSRFAITLAMLAVMSVAASAADWPRFMGPSANGISPERGINKDWNNRPPKMLWKTDMSDDGYSGPSVSGGRLYIIDHKDKQDIIRCIDMSTGKDVWTYAYKDAEKANFGFSHSTPTVDGGQVFTLGRMGLANCLDAKTGSVLWSRDILKDFGGKLPKWNYAMSPLVDGGKVILIPGGPEASVVTLDRKTGATIWKSGDDEPGYSTPQKVAINGKTQYLIYSGNYLSGLDPADGKQLWSVEWKTRSGVNAAAPIVMGNKVFITASYNHGCGLVEVTNEGAKLVWENKELLAHFSSPILVKDHIYGVGDPGRLMCIDPKTGNVVWKQEGFEKGPKMMVDGVLLVHDGKGGDLVMVDPSPSGYKELGRFKPLGDQSWTAPIVADGKLLVRNKTALACFDLK